MKKTIAQELYFPDFHSWYNFVKQNPFISFYIDGTKYFFFASKGRIYSISEFLLSFVTFTISFFGVVGVRKIFKRYEIGKHCRKKLQKILNKNRRGLNVLQKILEKLKNRRGLNVRSGENFENDILHYEVDVIDDGKNFLPQIFSKLTADERFVKGIVKKCLKQNRFYKISNRGLLEIIEQMMGFGKKDSTRIISYDVLIIALLKYGEPMSPIIYEGAIKIVRKLGYPAVVKFGPLIISLVIGIASGFGVNLISGNVLISFFSSIPTWLGSYRVAEYGRNALTIDCTDYVEELPFVETNLLPETNPNSKISVSLSKPNRHETFISTAPGQALHYEEKVKIESLDGFYKEVTKLDGEKTLTWKPHPHLKKSQVTENRHIPLKERAKTLADLRNLDSTRTRESAERIRNQIEKEQILLRIVDEFLE